MRRGGRREQNRARVFFQPGLSKPVPWSGFARVFNGGGDCLLPIGGFSIFVPRRRLQQFLPSGFTTFCQEIVPSFCASLLVPKKTSPFRESQTVHSLFSPPKVFTSLMNSSRLLKCLYTLAKRMYATLSTV